MCGVVECDSEGFWPRNRSRDRIWFACGAPVAQLDRASGYEPEGREFESLRAHHLIHTDTIG